MVEGTKRNGDGGQGATVAERQRAVFEARRLMLEEGLSSNQAAVRVGASVGRSGRRVQEWANEAGTPLGALAHDAAKQRASGAAERDYCAAERRALLNEALALGQAYLARGVEGLQPREWQSVMVGIAIGIDKLRLEEGLATGRTEVADVTQLSDTALEREVAAIAARVAPAGAGAAPAQPGGDVQK